MNPSEKAGAPAGAPYNSVLRIARDLALEAAARITTLRQSPLVQERKSDHSIVTNADYEADRIIRNGLRKAFPDHAILTEESGMDGSPDAEYVWVVDPIDGTRAYVKGVAGFSVMIGLLKDGKPFAGVVADPFENHLYEAVKGEGSWCDGVKVRVSERKDLDQMPIIASTGFPERLHRPIGEQLRGPWLPEVNSVGIKVGYLVRQLADIYFNHQKVHFWDTCAPQIILEEAGGVITFMDGHPLTYPMASGTYRHEAQTLATNGLRHQEILTIFGSFKPPLS